MLPFVYWINLERSDARRRRMQAALDERGLLNARVEAVDGADPSALLAAMHTVIGRPAELACTASHLRAIEQIGRAHV